MIESRAPAGAARCRASGFTLLEILVALSIVAIGLTAAIRAGLATTATVAELRARQQASWVAENRLALLRASREWPAIGESSGEARMGDDDFRWQLLVTPATHRLFRRVEVRVSAAASAPLAAHVPPAPLAQLVTYLAAP